ncbi:hypothetical protein HIM_10094 [Hirsutella minnesotensis 3608]|uniref:BTB domain-containing protein n=1 Tax=Hirsutella minnesotensis 3608 TaxID=1043627 RepID=A0A0F7ZS02_9HYPO|nr:hypothetical protein HIM_10094 [Hirsutella minnesotensis 3608]
MSPSTIDIDPDGELIIHLGDESTGISHSTASVGTNPDVKLDQTAAHKGDATFDSAVQLRVSMKHILLACRRAKTVFGGAFQESKPEADGSHHWRLGPYFDSKAFITVMSIIHGHTREIPDQVSLSMLAAISAVTDDLQCHDAVWFIAKLWLRKLHGTLSVTTPDLPKWILVSFVFHERDMFRSVTRVAILHSSGAITTGDLPIFPKIVGTSRL